jgi:hypothetical protein
MPAPQKVLDLIDTFARNAQDYHSSNFNEEIRIAEEGTETRK